MISNWKGLVKVVGLSKTTYGGQEKTETTARLGGTRPGRGTKDAKTCAPSLSQRESSRKRRTTYHVDYIDKRHSATVSEEMMIVVFVEGLIVDVVMRRC